MTSPDILAGVDDNNDCEPSTLGLIDGEFDTLVEKLLDEHHVPGMSIAIVHNGKMKCKVSLSGDHGYLV